MRKMQSIASAGVDWVQIREKDLSARELATVTRELLQYIAQLSSGPGRRPVRILINDRLDVAVAEGAAGVHLGEHSVSVSEAKRFLHASSALQAHPGRFLVGASCHSLQAAQSAARDGADYIFFGPVFATPSKVPYGAPQGLDRLSEVCLAVSIPVLAIGGITLQNAPSCLAAGAAGIAAIRLFQDATDPAELLTALRQL
jgi:thiamine-phosphate pyrophosphorylase